MRSIHTWILFFPVFFILSSVSHAEENKFINYGNGIINASKYANIKLSITDFQPHDIDQAIKQNGTVSLQAAIIFSQPSEFKLTILNQGYKTTQSAIEGLNEAKKSYAKIIKFLKSSESYLDLDN